MSFSLSDRHARVIFLRETSDRTFRAIGLEIGCGPARAAQVYHEAKRRQKFHEEGAASNPYYGLSARAANCCNNANLMTREQIEAAVKSGKLHPNKNRQGRYFCRNYGKKTHNEVLTWLGLPLPQKSQKTCPHCGGKI